MCACERVCLLACEHVHMCTYVHLPLLTDLLFPFFHKLSKFGFLGAQVLKPMDIRMHVRATELARSHTGLTQWTATACTAKHTVIHGRKKADLLISCSFSYRSSLLADLRSLKSFSLFDSLSRTLSSSCNDRHIHMYVCVIIQ